MDILAEIRHLPNISIREASLLAHEINESAIGRPTKITIEYVEKVICIYFEITPEKLKENTRKTETVQKRQLAMVFSKLLTNENQTTIARYFGRKEHSTIYNACKTVNNLYDTELKFRKQYDEIENKLKN